MKDKYLNKILINAILMVLIILCFSACGKDKKPNVFLSEKENESKTEGIANNNADSHSNNEDVNSKEILDKETLDKVLPKVIYVQVNGAVNNPGVYKIEKEMRVFEVIELAGGVTTEASTEAINMARPVTDEMVIYVPTNEEVNLGFSEEKETVFEDYKLDDSEKILVNINTASIEELMSLSGIGEVKAKQIIDYREENGVFKDISELMNISGIKQSAFDKIKDYITV